MDNPMLVKYYEIVMLVYHGTTVARLRYTDGDRIEESGLFSPREINNLLMLWKDGGLLGSFGAGTRLAPDATFQLCSE